MVLMPALSVPPPNLVVVPSNTSNLEMLQRPLEFAQYASAQFRAWINQYRIIQSMSRKANCWDNAPMESFFKSLKVECAHRFKSQTRSMVKLNLVDRIEGFYNAQRLHSALDHQAPNKFERSLIAA